MPRTVLVNNSTVGGMAVAVPGELAGLEYAWLNYGSGNVRGMTRVVVTTDAQLRVVTDATLCNATQHNTTHRWSGRTLSSLRSNLPSILPLGICSPSGSRYVSSSDTHTTRHDPRHDPTRPDTTHTTRHDTNQLIPLGAAQSYLPAILNDTGLSSVYAPKGVALKAGELHVLPGPRPRPTRTCNTYAALLCVACRACVVCVILMYVQCFQRQAGGDASDGG